MNPIFEAHEKIYGDPSHPNHETWNEIKTAYLAKKCHKSYGEYEKETDSCSHFDKISDTKWFNVEHEVTGRRIFDDKPTQDKSTQRCRIDRILHPTIHAIDAGWIFGPIGVEIKRSGVKLGKVFAQVYEQRQSVFMSRHLNFTRIMPQIFSIFPAHAPSYELHSFSEQQMIFACEYDGKFISIKSFSKNYLVFNKKNLYVPNNPLKTKRGSRS